MLEVYCIVCLRITFLIWEGSSFSNTKRREAEWNLIGPSVCTATTNWIMSWFLCSNGSCRRQFHVVHYRSDKRFPDAEFFRQIGPPYRLIKVFTFLSVLSICFLIMINPDVVLPRNFMLKEFSTLSLFSVRPGPTLAKLMLLLVLNCFDKASFTYILQKALATIEGQMRLELSHLYIGTPQCYDS